MAYNNTYGLRAYGTDVFDLVTGNVTAPGVGCYDLADKCRAKVKQLDPTSQGNNDEVNKACQAASNVCLGVVLATYASATTVSARRVKSSLLAKC